MRGGPSAAHSTLNITTVRLTREVIVVSASRDEHLARGIGGVDLNLRVKGFAEDLGRWLPRSADARRQDPVRASHGLFAVEHLSANRGHVPRRSSRTNAFLCRAVSVHGLRADHVPRESARYRGLS